MSLSGTVSANKGLAQGYQPLYPNMPPTFSSNYVPDSAFAHAKFSRKHRWPNTRVFREYSHYLLFVQSRKRIFGSAHHDPAILGTHINHVILISTKKQMVRIGARWIVTLMADKKATWYIAEVYNPGYSMSASRNSVVMDSSVTLITKCARPSPAFIRPTFEYSGPEPIHNIYFTGFNSASRAAVFADTLTYVVGFGVEFRVAFEAISDHINAL